MCLSDTHAGFKSVEQEVKDGNVEASVAQVVSRHRMFSLVERSSHCVEQIQGGKTDTETQVDIDAWRFPSAEVSTMLVNVFSVSMYTAIALIESCKIIASRIHEHPSGHTSLYLSIHQMRTHEYSQAIREELSKEFSNEQKEKVWTDAAEVVKQSYDQLLGRWKEEIDTLLVYVSDVLDVVDGLKAHRLWLGRTLFSRFDCIQCGDL